MIIDTIFSLRRMERLSRTSYHLAKTAFKGHHAGKLSSVHVFGGAVCSVAHVCINPRLSWIQMEDGKPAPEAVLERLACRCPRSFTPQTAFAWRTSQHVHRLVLTAGSKPHRRMWKSLLMDIAKRRMKVVTEKSAYTNDTPLLCSSATVQA